VDFTKNVMCFNIFKLLLCCVCFLLIFNFWVLTRCLTLISGCGLVWFITNRFEVFPFAVKIVNAGMNV